MMLENRSAAAVRRNTRGIHVGVLTSETIDMLENIEDTRAVVSGLLRRGVEVGPQGLRHLQEAIRDLDMMESRLQTQLGENLELDRFTEGRQVARTSAGNSQGAVAVQPRAILERHDDVDYDFYYDDYDDDDYYYQDIRPGDYLDESTSSDDAENEPENGADDKDDASSSFSGDSGNNHKRIKKFKLYKDPKSVADGKLAASASKVETAEGKQEEAEELPPTFRWVHLEIV